MEAKAKLVITPPQGGDDIVIVVREAKRRQGIVRMRLFQEALDWARANGLGGDDFEDEELETDFVILQQGANVQAALVPEECEGFEAPDQIKGWLDVPDWQFFPALNAVWTLNPHWAPIPAESPEKNAKEPGS